MRANLYILFLLIGSVAYSEVYICQPRCVRTVQHQESDGTIVTLVTNNSRMRGIIDVERQKAFQTAQEECLSNFENGGKLLHSLKVAPSQTKVFSPSAGREFQNIVYDKVIEGTEIDASVEADCKLFVPKI